MTPDELGAAVDARDAVAVTALLVAATEQERTRCATLARQRLSTGVDWHGDGTASLYNGELPDLQAWQHHYSALLRQDAVLALAVLGTARTARQAAGKLNLIDIEAEPQAVAILGQRPRPWLEEFCEHALSGQSVNPWAGWRLTRALVRAGHIARPGAESYISLMPGAINPSYGPDTPPLRQLLLADPGLLQDEIFGLFAVEDAARALYWADHWTEEAPHARADRSWRATLAGLAAEGHIDRGRLLDACLGAFFCDFQPGQLTWYVRFHVELAPALEEIAARSGRYLRLLAADAGTAVGLGQNAIRTLLTGGLADPGEIVEASDSVLARPEKKYVVTQLRLLDMVARGHPDLAERAVEAAAAAFGHPRAEVAEQALDLAARHDRQLGEATRAKLRAAGSSLAPSLRSRAEAVLGGCGAGPSRDIAPAPAGPEIPAAPPRVGSLSELASTVAELAADPWDPLLAEQVFDGIARFAADRAAFTAALAPLARHLQGSAEGTGAPPLRALTWILQGADPADGMLTELTDPNWAWPYPRRPVGPSPRTLFSHRLWEVYTRASDGQARPLLSHPDTAAGHVDPERVVGEVAALEDSGAEPWPADLIQTVLRLPRTADGRVMAAAARLRSRAGRALADVLGRGTVPDPVTELGRDSRGVLLVNTGVHGVAPVKMHVDPAAPVTGDLLRGIWELREYDDLEWPAEELPVWAHALPSHREVAAVHALQVMSAVDTGLGSMRPDGRFVVGLPDMQGPAGPAVVLTVAYSLFAHDPAHRAAAVEALTAFARHGSGASQAPGSGIDGGAVGRMLGEMNAVRAGRVADCLRSAAADPGTRQLAWEIAGSAIPGLLRSGARDTHRLLAVAADLAAELGVRAQIDGLAQAAAATGSTRLAAEARRLHALM